MGSRAPESIPGRIGVLDLQGGVVEHVEHLEQLGVTPVKVRYPEQIRGLAGLILPGGESTCVGRLLHLLGIDAAIRDAFARGLKLWGTCAGAILLANRLRGQSPHLALIDIEIERNAFGSQLDSFNTVASIPKVAPAPLPLTFIRAPKIRAVGPGVEVLLRMHDYIAAAESAQTLVTVFHPELTPALAFHRYFLEKCGIPVAPDAPEFEPGWTLTTWTRHLRIADPAGSR